MDAHSNLEKQVSAHEFSLAHEPPPAGHSPFWRQMVYQSVLYQTNESVPGRKYFTPMEAQLQSKIKARLSSYHWSRARDSMLLKGAERGIACFSSCVFPCGLSAARPRPLNSGVRCFLVSSQYQSLKCKMFQLSIIDLE